jgi:hypothetical protein
MPAKRRSEQRFAFSLPPHVMPEAEGLGDAVKRVTNAVGIRPCGGCERRAQALNRAFPITHGRKR